MRNYLGSFEEIVLLSVAVLRTDAYGVSIRDEIERQTGHAASIGALHATLTRLEGKGLLLSETGGVTAARGGRRKRFYRLTAAGQAALEEAQRIRSSFWDRLNPSTWS
ncbi:MAG: helix-turn-helix transcriptional regulator [Bacteroidota bacterium]